jgi:hypothetical protein
MREIVFGWMPISGQLRGHEQRHEKQAGQTAKNHQSNSTLRFAESSSHPISAIGELTPNMGFAGGVKSDSHASSSPASLHAEGP